jgi:hypothetical protein
MSAGILETIIVFAPHIIAAAGAAWGVYEKLKAKRYSEALDLSTNGLTSVVAAIEAWEIINGKTAQSESLKNTIRRVATRTHAERLAIAPIVREVSLLISEGMKRDGGNAVASDIAVRAAEAAAAARKAAR